MSSFRITLNTTGAAFTDGEGRELAALLREVADKVAELPRAPIDNRPIVDSNGNIVGRFTWVVPKKEITTP